MSRRTLQEYIGAQADDGGAGPSTAIDWRSWGLVAFGVVAACAIAALGVAIAGLVRAEKAVKDAGSASDMVDALGVKPVPKPYIRDTITMVNGLLSQFNRDVASGAERLPTEADLARIQKLAALAEDLPPSIEPETGEAISAYQSDFFAQQGAKRDAIVVPDDYDVDYDNDGVPDFAVVHLSPDMVLPPLPYTPFDIPAGTQILFAAQPGGNSYEISRASAVSLLSIAGHAKITDFTNNDDGFTTRTLAHSFQFNGSAWTSVFVNTDGGLTFGASSADASNRALARFFGMPPLISALFVDLDIGCTTNPAVGVYFYSDASSSVFTWNNVVHFEREARFGGCPQTIGSTFQMILYASGSIEFRYGSIDAATIAVIGRSNSVAFTGISNGAGHAYPVNYLNFSSFASPTTVTVGSVVEGWNFASTNDNILRTLTMNKFYTTHGRLYDSLMMLHYGWGDLTTPMPGVEGISGFYSTSNYNPTSGLGRSVSAAPGVFGAEQEGFISLGWMEVYNGKSVYDLVEPRITPISIANGYEIAKGLVNRSSVLTPISDMAFPYSMTLVGTGASTGYTHEETATWSGAFMSRPVIRPGFGSGLMQIAAHELFHRWNRFLGFRHPNSTLWGSTFNALLQTDLAHPSPFVDGRTNTDAASSPWGDRDATFTAKRPRGDPMFYSSGHLTQLLPNLVDGASFFDASNPAIVYPDTPKHNMSIAYALCMAQGLDLFVHTPQSVLGSFSVESLALAGIIPIPSVKNHTSYYVENPRSPYAAFGYTMDLNTLPPATFGARGNNLLFCGKRRNITFADMVENVDVRRSPQVQAVLGPISLTTATRNYGPREPLIGDEGDTIDPAIDALYPQLRARWNLDACPIVNSPLCNSPPLTPGKKDAVCVDIKTVAPFVAVRPGMTVKSSDLAIMATIVEALRTTLPTYYLDGYGARGRVGDQCYLPKFDFSIAPLIH